MSHRITRLIHLKKKKKKHTVRCLFNRCTRQQNKPPHCYEKKIFPNTGLNTQVGQQDPFYCADVKALVVGNGDLSDNRCHV